MVEKKKSEPAAKPVKKKKKKRSAETTHRQIQDSVMALPYVIEQQKKEGNWFRAWMLRYVSGPMLRLVNKGMSYRRYRGVEGQKLKQTEQMRRHLDHRQQAMKHYQGQIDEMRKRRR
jgi:hypothetical protein